MKSVWMFEVQRAAYRVKALFLECLVTNWLFQNLFWCNKSGARNSESSICPIPSQKKRKKISWGVIFHLHAWIRFLAEAISTRKRSSRQREGIGVQSSAPSFEVQTELKGNRVKQTENSFWRHLGMFSGMCTAFLSSHFVQMKIFIC